MELTEDLQDVASPMSIPGIFTTASFDIFITVLLDISINVVHDISITGTLGVAVGEAAFEMYEVVAESIEVSIDSVVWTIATPCKVASFDETLEKEMKA